MQIRINPLRGSSEVQIQLNYCEGCMHGKLMINDIPFSIKAIEVAYDDVACDEMHAINARYNNILADWLMNDCNHQPHLMTFDNKKYFIHISVDSIDDRQFIPY
jgi:hypothetical protein